MPYPYRRTLVRAAALLLALALPARSAPADVRLVSSDARGATLKLDLDSWRLQPVPSAIRQRISAPGLRMLDQPGRPQLPYATALIALPPGARASAAVVASDAGETREGTRVEIAPRSIIRRAAPALADHFDLEDVPAIADGPWPASVVELGEPFELRGQRLVAIAIHPFQYDEAAARLVAHRSVTVRVTFVGGKTVAGGALAESRFSEPVLKSAVLNYEQGRSLRVPRLRPQPRLGGPGAFGVRAANGALAFDEGQPEVRVKLDSTGVWGINFDDLSAAGFPAGVPDTEVSVHRHEFLQDATPSYGTIELPIEVDDYNGNGVFDSGDRIEVFVEDWAKRSGASQALRAWGDAEVVYATSLPGRAGRRVADRPGAPSRLGLTPRSSYPYTRRFEQSFSDLFGFPSDTLTDLFDWTSNTTYYDRPDTILFETSQLDTSVAAQLSVRLQGRKYEIHVFFGAIENKLGQFTSVFDSTNATWYSLDGLTVPTPIHGSALSEGRTNHLQLWAKNDPGPPPGPLTATAAGLNYFDLTYGRRFVPIRDYLDCNSGAASGPYEILATAFTDSTFLKAWDVTDPLDPRHLRGVKFEKNGVAWNLRLQDSTGGSARHYLVFANPKNTPADHITPVTRRSLWLESMADYILVVPEAFLPVVQPLVDLRRAQGLSVLVAPLESINDEFNGGRHADFAIKRLIRYGYYHWNTSFVTLLGDGATEDPLNHLGGSNPDWVPSHRVQGPVGIFVGGFYLQEIVPSDNWFGWCIDDAGCPDPDNHPSLVDVYIGRLPVNSLAEAQSVVHKLVRYETVQPADLWRRRMVLQSDDAFSGDNLFGGGSTQTLGYCLHRGERIFESLNASIKDVVVNRAGLRQAEPELFNNSEYLATEAFQVVPCNFPGCVPDTCRPDRTVTGTHARGLITPALFLRLNDGRLWWNYQGHANEQLLSHESFYVDNKTTIDDTQNFTNAGKPFLFSAFSCHSNNFGRRWENGGIVGAAFGPGLGPDLVTLDGDRGAIASWASSGYELIPTNYSDHLNVEFARSMFFQPPRDPILSDRGARVVMGEAVELTLLRWETSPNAYFGEKQVGVTYTLLGDPATRLSIGSPQALVTANGDTVTDDIAVHLKTPGDSLRLEADLVSNQQITQLSLDRSIDGANATVLPPASYTLAPAFGDTATGGRRYHLTYRANLALNDYHFTLRTLDREGTPGAFDVLLPLQCVLRAEGVPINDGDPVSPNANLSLLVSAPAPIHPGADLTITVNGQAVTFDSTMVAGDATGRQWILSWTHGPYPIDAYTVSVATSSGSKCDHRFRVDIGGNETRLQNVLAFPNPFDEDRGTFVSFTLVSGAPADVLLRVYTIAGRLLYTRTERQLLPGYHQLPWNGLDAEGYTIANGLYVYKLVASNGKSSASFEGRLVKLRRPHRSTLP